MDAKTKLVVNEAIERVARSLRQEHWQALVVVKGGKFPYTFADKLKVVKELMIPERK